MDNGDESDTTAESSAQMARRSSGVAPSPPEKEEERDRPATSEAAGGVEETASGGDTGNDASCASVGADRGQEEHCEDVAAAGNWVDRGPPKWLDAVRDQMQSASPFARKEALGSLLAHALPQADGGRDGLWRACVHKAVLRAAASLLTDSVLHVREEAQSTLVKISACFPAMQSACVKYAGQHLTMAAPVRIRLFLLHAIKLFVVHSLPHNHTGRPPVPAAEQRIEQGAYPSAAPDLYFEGTRLAAISALEGYVQAEELSLRHKTYLGTGSAPMLIESSDAEDGSPLALWEVDTLLQPSGVNPYLLPPTHYPLLTTPPHPSAGWAEIVGAERLPGTLRVATRTPKP
jgi:hypothetical protein